MSGISSALKILMINSEMKLRWFHCDYYRVPRIQECHMIINFIHTESSNVTVKLLLISSGLPNYIMIHLRKQLATRLYLTSRSNISACNRNQCIHYSDKPSTPVDPNPKSSRQDPPAERYNSSSMIRQEDAAEGTPHAPDYNVARDYRTSYENYLS